jgi:hypothetical protein
MDLEHRRPAVFHNLYNQALAALEAYGHPIRFEIQQVLNCVDECVIFPQAASRMVDLLDSTS